jgi:DNA (cytosine-5)-methyltransferase 1
MIGTSQLRLYEPTSKDSPAAAARSYISYSVDSSYIYRHARRSNGELVTSSVARLATGGNLAADFDLSWLRSKSCPRLEATTSTIRVADLFSGFGGMSVGIREGCRALGIRCEFAFAAELDPVKADIYATNLSPCEMLSGPLEASVDGDLGKPPSSSEQALLDRVGTIDFLLGGPPCQGHSDLNNYTRRDDVRNRLITRMARFAELFMPTNVVIENVQGVRHDKQGAASHTASYLMALGYEVEELLVPFARVGVPQTRRRYMLIATKKNWGGIRDLESLGCEPRTVGWAIQDLLEMNATAMFDTSATHSPENQRRIQYLFDHELFDLPDRERPACHRLKDHTYKGVYGRMRWDAPAPTITTGFGSTGQGRYVHPLRPRTLTPHEAARLQTIPDFFHFGEPGRTQLQKMIGNGVPPLAMAALAMSVLR